MLRDGFWVPHKCRHQLGLQHGQTTRFSFRERERSWPLGTPQAISITQSFFPMGFWQNEHWDEPGNCFWSTALGSKGWTSSKRLEGKSCRCYRNRQFLIKYSAQAAFEPAVNSSLAKSVIAFPKYRSKNVFAQHKPDLYQHFPLCAFIPFPQDSRSEKFTLVKDLSPC